MSRADQIQEEFIDQITAVIEDNIANEQFGVSELADAIGMSRSNLLRRVKKSSNLSVSQFIRQVRLQKAMELLKDSTLTISEISYQVGFGSTSYFIKCFKESYGYPPGEVGMRVETEQLEKKTTPKNKIASLRYPVIVSVLVVIISILVFPKFFRSNEEATTNARLEKSIAVLPFKNDSNDSTNIHIINGLMESTLNKLQKIEDLRVISRTSVEKYRYSNKTIPELSQDFSVSYFVEGSGQKIGDQILLTIQLIEGPTDKHLWSRQYNREAKDIFTLQQEIAKDITSEIQVIITPEEKERIERIPTENLEAYNLFLKGVDAYYEGTEPGMRKAIDYLNRAIIIDQNFASAYGLLAIVYYYLDLLSGDKRFSTLINLNADKALLLDPTLPEALIGKGLYYMNIREYDQALSPLEKALEYNPNSEIAINTLADYYTNYRPDTRLYLKYALMGLALGEGGSDSSLKSYTYLHIANAFIQNGFQEEAAMYIDESLDYNPNNLFSAYVKSFIHYADHRNLDTIRQELLTTLMRDTTRVDILQELASMCYYQRDYEAAFKYFSIFHQAKVKYNLAIYPDEDIKIAFLYGKNGKKETEEKLLLNYKFYAENDKSIYRDLSMSMFYAYQNRPDRAIEYLNEFAKQERFQYWIIIFTDMDPIFDGIRDMPEYQQVMKKLEENFWKTHEEIKATLLKDGLI